MKGPLEAVFFDLDGTLVDTAGDFHAILNELRHEYNLPPLPLSVVSAWVSQGSLHVIREGFRETELNDTQLESIRTDFLHRYALSLDVHACLFPGMPELLQALAEAAIPWGIITNKLSRYTFPLLASLQLSPASVICPDMVSKTKPDPEGLMRAAAEVGADPVNCLYIGDHERDIAAGHRAGMTTIAVAWGYILPGDDIDTWHADHVVCDAAELNHIIASLRTYHA
ncbi:MAG: HAD-IA family hydrolase [Pseudomonadales bacterium]|nr:HAD-IA family hydrolase [Pseudomonadales bacterium]